MDRYPGRWWNPWTYLKNYVAETWELVLEQRQLYKEDQEIRRLERENRRALCDSRNQESTSTEAPEAVQNSTPLWERKVKKSRKVDPKDPLAKHVYHLENPYMNPFEEPEPKIWHAPGTPEAKLEMEKRKKERRKEKKRSDIPV
ncbi:Protein CBG26641 [Caenorhabditis briggsae]|uniref:Protein CBG26641 n=2 Tax=Caenorhabditis briggsae TaxID=6238 RepID=B6IE05_CAEBR|nr:Protein CBG26641 [Caenorhabditis briggsae]ULT86750.1 hypothetical protein L3Y34_006454 [Caenorhabditis briggsae]CAS01069.1 Protein CBG26641 [Caenorhabditis briggsae]